MKVEFQPKSNTGVPLRASEKKPVGKYKWPKQRLTGPGPQAIGGQHRGPEGPLGKDGRYSFRGESRAANAGPVSRGELKSGARRLLEGIRRWSLSATCKCRRARTSKHGNVDVLVDQHGAVRLSGVQTCKSIWACPCCSTQIRAKRAQVISEVVSKMANEPGTKGWFVTLTLRHSKKARLKQLLGAIRDAFRLSSQGRGNWKKQLGVKHYVRVLEVTWSESNGWHPHYHCIIWTGTDESKETVQKVLTDRWLHCLKASGADATAARGIDVQEVGKGSGCAEYISKMGLELSSEGKESRSGGLTQWAIARMAARCGSCKNGPVKLWREFITATRGVRQMGASVGLLSKQQLETDGDGDEDVSEDGPAIAGTFNWREWRWGAWNVPGWSALVVESAERGYWSLRKVILAAKRKAKEKEEIKKANLNRLAFAEQRRCAGLVR